MYVNEPDKTLEEIIERAVRDAKALEEGGVDAVLIENYGDKPFRVRVNSLTTSIMTRIVHEVKREVDVEVGVSVLRNSAPEAVAVALATGASFIRSNQWCWSSDAPEGILTPVVHEALEIMSAFGKKVKVIADVRVKHSSPISNRSICLEAKDLAKRCEVDVIAVSGEVTGEAPNPNELRTVRRCVGKEKEVYVSSGVNPENVYAFAEADGFIVGTYFKFDAITENPVDVERVKKFLSKLKELGWR